MRQRRIGCAVIALASVTQLSATMLDFETPLPGGLVPNGSFAQGASVSSTAQITNQYESVGVLFSTAGGAGYAALIALGPGHATSGVNGVGAVASNGTIDYTLDIDIFFVAPGTLTPAVTDAVSIRGDEIPIPGNVVFTAYDVNGNVVATNTLPDTGGGTYELTGAGIHEFRLHSTSGTVAYDDLQFDTPAFIGAVGTPEPSTFALLALAMLLGAMFGLRLKLVAGFQFAAVNLVAAWRNLDAARGPGEN